MSPRRPSPARPGARPPGRRDARGTAGSTSSRRAPRSASSEDTATSASTEQTVLRRAQNGASERAEVRGRRRESGGARGEYTVLRMGSPDGATMTIPARMIVLVIALLAAFIIVFPALRGFLAQQAQYDALTAQLASARATSTALEKDLSRWQDDDYVRAQARQRLFYVMPGETTYVVVGADRFEQQVDEEQAAKEASRPWYQKLTESAAVAGATGETKPEQNQKGWSTAVPTVPTPGATTAPTPAPTATK